MNIFSTAASYGSNFLNSFYVEDDEESDYIYGDGTLEEAPVDETPGLFSKKGVEEAAEKVAKTVSDVKEAVKGFVNAPHAENVAKTASEVKEAVKGFVNAPRTEKVTADPKLRALEVELARVIFPVAGKVIGLESILERGWNFFSWVFEPLHAVGASKVRKGASYGSVRETFDSGLGTGFVQDKMKAQYNKLFESLSDEKALRSKIPFNIIKKHSVSKTSNILVRIINKVVQAIVPVFSAIANFFTAIKLRLMTAPTVNIIVRIINKVAEVIVSAFSAIANFFKFLAIKLRLMTAPTVPSKEYLALLATKKKLEDDANADLATLQKFYDLYSARESLVLGHEKLLSKHLLSDQEKQEKDKINAQILKIQADIDALEKSDSFTKSDGIQAVMKDSFKVIAKVDFVESTKSEEKVELFKDYFLAEINKLSDALKKNQLEQSNVHTITYEENILKGINKVELDKLRQEHALNVAAMSAHPEEIEKLNAKLLADIEIINKSTEVCLKERIAELDIETTNSYVRLHTDNMGATVAVSNLWARAGKKVSDIFSSAGIDHSLKLLREHVLGSKNQDKVKVLVKKVQDSVITNLTENLKAVNDIYSEPLMAVDEDLEDRILKKLAWDGKLHSAVLFVSPYEKEIAAKKEEFKNLTLKIQSLKKDEIIFVANGNISKLEACRAELLESNKKLEENRLTAQELQTLEAVEKRIASCEADYFKKLTNEIIDYVLFPDGIPKNFKNLLWFAGITVDSQYKDARGYIFNKINTALTNTVRDNVDKPQQLEKFFDDLIAGAKLTEWQSSQILPTLKSRLKMNLVNKHLLFTALDEAIKVLKG